MDNSQPTAVQTPVNLGIATAAFVFGILSFFCIPFCGLVALILGIIALSKISKSNGLLLGKGKAIAGIVFGCWAVLRAILAVLLLSAVNKAHHHGAAYRIACLNNLKQIGILIYMFADDHSDNLPTSTGCEEQINEYVNDMKCIRCPRNNNPYRFFVNGQKLTGMTEPDKTIMAICPSEHISNRVNVLFGDGHVEAWDKWQVDEAIRNAEPGALPVLR